MFKKLKGKFGKVFSRSEKEIFNEEEGFLEDIKNQQKEEEREEKEEEIKNDNQEELKEIEETDKKEKDNKKGFFKSLFSKNEEENFDDIETTLNKKSKEELEESFEETDEREKDTQNNLEETDTKTETENDSGKESFIKKTFSKITAKTITENDFETIWLDLEIYLLEINIAYEIVELIKEELKREILDKKFNRFTLNKKIREVLIEEITKVLKDRESSFIKLLKEHLDKERPVKIVFLGVNGTGKTTSIAKIVNFLQKQDISTVVSCSDTFRAAATEQLEEHSHKLNFKLIKHKNGSDPAAVAYDAINHAKSKNIDVVIIDTAGRMPNNPNLMNELLKIKRIAKTEITIFIGDSISGNDLVEQIETFDKVVGIDGVILTKVDTDERPGSIVTTAYSISKPIFFLGTGQNYGDLVEFNSKTVAEKLFELE